MPEGGDVKVARGVGDRLGVGIRDLLRYRGRVIVGVDVAGGRDARFVVLRHRSGQGEPQLGVAAQANRAAEADHAGGGRAAGTGQFGDVPPGDTGRVVEDRLGHPAFYRGQVRQQGPDRDEDAEVRCPVLVFGHPARLPQVSGRV